MENLINYNVRIITDSKELTAALALRYKIYKKTYPEVVKKLTHSFESDQFDYRSIHIGLYCEDSNGIRLVGYSRFILPESFVGKYAGHLIPRHEKYPLKSLQSNSEDLHFMKDLPEDSLATINSFCAELRKNDRLYIETGRFIISDEHRSITISSFFSKAMIILGNMFNINFAFFCCSTQHATFYKRSGLTPFEGIEMYYSNSFENNFMIFGTNMDVFYKNSFNIVNESDNHFLPEKMLELRKVA